MKRYAIADEVPKYCGYLTAGKEYEIKSQSNDLFSIFDDVGIGQVCTPDNCWSLNGKSWRIVEREE